jgi:hypothetical protein
MVAGFYGNVFLNFYEEDFFLKTLGLERHVVYAEPQYGRAIAKLCPHPRSSWIGTGSLSDLQTSVAQASMNQRPWSTNFGLVFISTLGWRCVGGGLRKMLAPSCKSAQRSPLLRNRNAA